MDDLRIALLIAGIVVVVVVYAYARHSRRRAARKAEEMELGSLDSRDDWEIVPIDRTSPEPGEARDGTDTGEHVHGLGGMFAPSRDTSDAEPSVDLDILAGLRATYESTIDGTVDESIAREPSEDGAVEESTAPGPPEDGTAAGSIAGVDGDRPLATTGAEPLIAVDMTRPLVYLTLVAKQEVVPGRVVLESLEAEGFRPGLMRLYYWRNDAESSVVFGAANMVEPGVLDPGELPGMETPGLVTFMSVPPDGATAFRILDAMVAVSRRLARRLDATLCDETRSTLTAQAENHLREKIADALRQDRIRD
ncbi:MAG: cell division protein ZipA C-terminal FtsZ-binding domain-containing protein [Chromatiales bacterium]|nr:cell division protein ZipA C-terminal FtsZ-binding domain-containing protein [Chromatiales bacterium]